MSLSAITCVTFSEHLYWSHFKLKKVSGTMSPLVNSPLLSGALLLERDENVDRAWGKIWNAVTVQMCTNMLTDKKGIFTRMSFFMVLSIIHYNNMSVCLWFCACPLPSLPCNINWFIMKNAFIKKQILRITFLWCFSCLPKTTNMKTSTMKGTMTKVTHLSTSYLFSYFAYL